MSNRDSKENVIAFETVSIFYTFTATNLIYLPDH